MKECNKVFFGDSGLTSTRANHLANIANEMIQNAKTELEIISFLDISVGTITQTTPDRFISKGVVDSQIGVLQDHIKFISDANAFVAWVREAIKAKEFELNYVNMLGIIDYCNLNNIIYKYAKLKEISEEDILGFWNIKDRSEYYALEAEAAAIGKYIHLNGTIAKARKDLQVKILNPSVVNTDKQEVLIYTYTPSLSPSKVEDLYFTLQNKHREVSARLNKLKFRLKKELSDAQLELSNNYNAELEEQTAQNERLQSELGIFKLTETKRISELKIIIPKNLQTIYELLTKVSENR